MAKPSARPDDYAQQLAAQQSLTYIHGFNDPPIIAGQGTMGLEILEQVPDLETVVVPIGGAGLAAGVGLAIKSLRPEVKIFGVEPERAASYSAARGRTSRRRGAAAHLGRRLGRGPRRRSVIFRLRDSLSTAS